MNSLPRIVVRYCLIMLAVYLVVGVGLKWLI